MTPGITCLWQIRGRNTICDFDEWVRLDIEYIEKWSLWLDLRIMMLTLKKVLLRRGINAPHEATMPEFYGSSEASK